MEQSEKGGEKQKNFMKALKKVSNYLNNFLLAGVVYAQQTIDIVPRGEFAGLEKITVPNIINTALKLILIVASIVAVVFLVFGGIKWITSGGDKEATATAQKTITAAIIGLVVVFATWAIIRLLETFFGITIITSMAVPTIPPVPYTNQ